MLRAVASVGYLGCLPRLGGLVAAALGLGIAMALFLLTLSGTWVLAGSCFAFALTAWALPRALESARIDDSEIVIDRFAGIWLATAPVIPVSVLALTYGPIALALVFAVPLIAFHLILAGPLRKMGRSDRMWFRIGDDLLAGLVVMLLALAAMALFLVPAGNGGIPT